MRLADVVDRLRRSASGSASCSGRAAPARCCAESLDDALSASAPFHERRVRPLRPGRSRGHRRAARDRRAGRGDRLDVAFRQRLAERPGEDPRLAAHARLVSANARLRADR